MKTKDDKIVLLCECGDVSDQIIMRWFCNLEPDDEQDVYVSFFLRKLPFFKRVVLGLKYIFGYRSKYGEFGEVIIRPEDYTDVERVAETLKKEYERREKKIEKK